ncbi:GNAT family N-acetyltransferase [Sinorhizobium fredii]|uniref:GNAT family N-acetyltransferase n=1 Tax=Rhizobium fredii TaxID=380 RepID=UPI001F43A522|nr:GNAT family N-acetyltransferase [Sinorhizobium fredii]
MTPFGDTCSAINMIIVDESQRGRGLGRQLTSAVMELAGDRECRLTATSDGLPLYEKLGVRCDASNRPPPGRYWSRRYT